MRFFLSTKKNINYTDAGIYLRQDNLVKSRPNPWDDFGHVMLFHVVVKSNENKEQELGYSRVLINGENNTSEYFIKNGIFIPNGDIYEITDLLTKDKVVSLPEKISFYKALHNVFSRNDVRAFLSGICDASYNKNMHEKYLLWDGYKGALFRDSTSIDGILNTGKQIALGRNISDRHIIFNISNPPEGMDRIEFSFSKEIVDDIEPQHINLVIGKNGLGKTFLLKYISDIISGIQDNDDTPYFNKLLVVAFSPFEEFDTKKDVERKLIEKYYFDKLDNHASIQMDVNEYDYIGFRDNDGDFDRNQPKKNTTRYFVESIKLDNDEWWEEDKRIDLLLKTLRVAIDFNEILFQSIDGETICLKEVVVKDSIYLEKIDLEKEIRFIKNEQEVKLSSGQRIFSYMIPGIVSGITEKSLLIIDEPELYLHPTLEIALVRMLKNILAHRNSYAIIATHSAIIAREVKREYVHTLRGNLQNVRVAHPEIETLGESLDEIIGEVFDDYNTIKPYQNTIKDIFEKNESKKTKSQQSLFLEMKHKVGDDALIYLADLMDDPNDEFFIAGEK
ncbi:AAA family ATPase [Citrobacter freundii]|uniref:AAA family ATPase n=1 Tax=Citrobacter freundii TaxID=546 RepID=UPI001908F55E|nr:AAA family ATPase [Citrobacter freundii]MBJ8730510.1 ATP-binding protein [Citrobacter freundii]